MESVWLTDLVSSSSGNDNDESGGRFCRELRRVRLTILMLFPRHLVKCGRIIAAEAAVAFYFAREKSRSSRDAARTRRADETEFVALRVKIAQSWISVIRAIIFLDYRTTLR